MIGCGRCVCRFTEPRPPRPASSYEALRTCHGFSSFFFNTAQSSKCGWRTTPSALHGPRGMCAAACMRIRLRPSLARPAVPAASAQLTAAQVAPLVPPAQTSHKRFDRYLTSTAGLFVEMAVLFGLGTEPPEVWSTRNSEPKGCGISGACHRRRRRRCRRFRRRHVSSLELCL